MKNANKQIEELLGLEGICMHPDCFASYKFQETVFVSFFNAYTIKLCDEHMKQRNAERYLFAVEYNLPKTTFWQRWRCARQVRYL